MSGMVCFICREQNWNGNETVISVKRVERDDETCAMRTLVWKGMVCDKCLENHFGLLKEVVR